MPRSFLILFALLALSVAAHAQSACSVEVVAGLTTTDGRLVRATAGSDFALSAKGSTAVRLEGISLDQTPRRIVFVVQRGGEMNDAARTITTEVLTRILGRTRPEDRFGLVTTGPASTDIPVGTEPTKLLDQARALISEKPTGRPTSMLDGVQHALELLGESHPGDAVYVFAAHDEFEDGKKFDRIFDELLARKTRVFGFLFNYVMAGTISTMYTGWEFSTAMWSNEVDLNHLAWATGGSLIVENTQGRFHGYNVPPERMQQLTQVGYQLYGSIVEIHRLRLARSGNPKSVDWNLKITDEFRKSHPTAVVLYPRKLPACS